VTGRIEQSIQHTLPAGHPAAEPTPYCLLSPDSFRQALAAEPSVYTVLSPDSFRQAQATEPSVYCCLSPDSFRQALAAEPSVYTLLSPDSFHEAVAALPSVHVALPSKSFASRESSTSRLPVAGRSLPAAAAPSPSMFFDVEPMLAPDSMLNSILPIDYSPHLRPAASGLDGAHFSAASPRYQRRRPSLEEGSAVLPQQVHEALLQAGNCPSPIQLVELPPPEASEPDPSESSAPEDASPNMRIVGGDQRNNTYWDFDSESAYNDD
jgi:hypothetical protein